MINNFAHEIHAYYIIQNTSLKVDGSSYQVTHL